MPSDDASSHQDALRDSCARLFAQPTRLAQTLTHRVDPSFAIAPHTHERELQFDLLVGCNGRVWCDQRWTPIHGVTAMVAYPRQEHGYELVRGDEPSRVYHLRLRVEPSWPAVKRRSWPTLLTGLREDKALTAALRVVMRLGLVEAVRPPLLLARLSEALCLWPRDAKETTHVSDEPEELERGLNRAVAMIEQRVADPPSLEELAKVAHFSPRHFTRRFEAAFGCTPHTYITARRFQLARELLSQDRLKVVQVAEAVGFSTVATFSRWFSQQAGMSPTAFRADPSIG